MSAVRFGYNERTRLPELLRNHFRILGHYPNPESNGLSEYVSILFQAKDRLHARGAICSKLPHRGPWYGRASSNGQTEPSEQKNEQSSPEHCSISMSFN